MTSSRSLCAQVSKESAEPLAATASRIDHWILVEYRGLWSRDLLPQSVLSDDAKAHLHRQLDALPRSRLLFVRRPERRAEGHHVYVASSPERGGRLFHAELESYADLCRLDFAGALAGGPAPWAREVDHPLLVVCTHGKRDRCCAKFGRPLYQELRDQAEEGWVWQSSHVGGDRFAGNVVCLPAGLYFGRVERHDVWPLLDELLAGRIALDHYRGRSCYSFPEQAAERAVREAVGAAGVDDLALVSSERVGERWLVRFAASGEEHEVEVGAELGEPTYLTCEATRPTRPRRYVVTRYGASGG